jgi:3-isopropylmalate dehydrogenase
MSAAMLLEYLAFTTKLKNIYGVEVAIGYGVVTTDLNPDSKYGTNEIGEFISNFILNKDDLMYFNSGNVTIGQSTIFKRKMLLIFRIKYTNIYSDINGIK